MTETVPGIQVIQTRAYLTKAGHQQLDAALENQCRLYNAALEHRRGAWQMAGDSISKYTQSRELTEVRGDEPDGVGAVDRRVSVGTLDRLDRAFQAFFRRIGTGETPGYPRYKSARRFRTLYVYSGASKYLTVAADGRGQIRIKGLPRLKIKCARAGAFGQQPKTILITRKPNGAYVSLGFATQYPAVRDGPPANPVGVKAGVRQRFTLSNGETVDHRERDQTRIKRLQRTLDRQRRVARKQGRAEWQVINGRARHVWLQRSRSYDKTLALLLKAEHRESVRNVNALHQVTADLTKRFDAIYVEDLDIQALTAGRRREDEIEGRTASGQQELNRQVLEQTWGRIFDQLAYKAGRAGKQFTKVDPRDDANTCGQCGLRNAPSTARTFRCVGCGFSTGREINSARVVLNRGLLFRDGSHAGEPTPRGASARVVSRPENPVPT